MGAGRPLLRPELPEMKTATVQHQLARRTDPPEALDRATRMVVAVLGALVGAAGIEHGVGEMLQGPVRPDGLLIMSWPDAAALEVLSGEPAMTIIPDLRVTGLLAVAVGMTILVWSIGFVARRHGGSVLIGLSVLSLLLGGGLAPPAMGIVVGLVAARIGAPPGRRPGPLLRRLAPVWRWFLTAALVGYLGLMPGTLLAHAWGVADEALVIGLGAVAFVGFGLALAAARAHDRLQATAHERSPA